MYSLLGERMLMLKDEDFIGKGNERACYVHPNDPDKAVKVSYEQNKGRSKQSDTEINYYKQLQKRKHMDWKHLPKYFGEVQTNKGKGFMVELIRDYDGSISKSFKYYIEKEGLETYSKELEAYKKYLLDYCIIFNYGMMQGNILVRKNSETDFDLVLIDGLGDVCHFTLPNKIPYFARQRIHRRWNKFVNKYLQQSWIDAHRETK
jgi:hypothetical protein